MPLIYRTDVLPSGHYGMWHNIEGDAFFLDNMSLFDEEIQEISLLKGRKKSEWLSSRYLLHVLTDMDVRGACVKDEFGKPYIKGMNYFISISHTSDYTVAIGSYLPAGIDIQVIVPKIERIAHRFISAEEFDYIPDEQKIFYYHAIWGAKESLYKAYGKKELDFKRNIFVKSFVFEPKGFFFKGTVQKDEYYMDFTLFCKQFQNLILVYAIQS
ncbi:MAG: 4'-phosphopantetheinyl transferase superfamily protein [Saprospiraceae bacterium]